MEMYFSLCVGDVSLHRVSISSTSHIFSLCKISWLPSVSPDGHLWLDCANEGTESNYTSGQTG